MGGYKLGIGDGEGEEGFGVDVEGVKEDLVVGRGSDFGSEGGDGVVQEVLIAKTQNFQTHYV